MTLGNIYTTPLPQDPVKKPGQLTDQQVQQFYDQEYQNLWTNERLLNMAEQLIGPEIMGHPVWNVRPKIPVAETGIVPWHQDSAYLAESCANTLQVTFWIPFLNSNANNGCLQVVKGGHRKGVVAQHRGCWRSTWFIHTENEDMEKALDVHMETDVVTCEVPYGGVLVFTNLTPHRSLPNTSDDIRWSVDLRYQRPDLPTGFENVKDGILLQSKANPNLIIDWDKFNNDNRNARMLKDDETKKDPFDARISGPWMNRWPMIHHNEHNAHLLVKS